MLEAVVNPLPELTVTVHDIPIPIPGPDEALIKVVAAGSNVKEWLHFTAQKISLNSGDDIAGLIHDLGPTAKARGDLRIGDRVAAFHQMGTGGGAYAEYAIAPAHTTFIIPENITFEEAATIPLVSMTAALSLYRRHSLPPPWTPFPSSAPPFPLIVYGASSALGLFTIKLAHLSNMHPIIAIGGASREPVLELLDQSRGDVYIDRRIGVEEMRDSVRNALGPLKARHALDAFSSRGSWIPVSQMLEASRENGGSKLSVVSGVNTYDEAEIRDGVEVIYTYVGSAHTGKYLARMPKQPIAEEVEGDIRFAGVFFQYLTQVLAEGTFRGHPFTVTPGGLHGVEESLKALKAGEAQGRKFVCRISDTATIAQ
jgi:NADPH:quinone reductase